MAMSTTATPAHTPPQAPTPGMVATPGNRPPGVGMQGAPPVGVLAEPAKPVLFEDIDPVLLIRLYPWGQNVGELRALAMAAGEAAHEQGALLMAAQQEPVDIYDEAGVLVPRRDRDARAAELRRIEAERRGQPTHVATPPPPAPHQPPPPHS